MQVWVIFYLCLGYKANLENLPVLRRGFINSNDLFESVFIEAVFIPVICRGKRMIKYSLLSLGVLLIVPSASL